jgi:hypothetical protein
LKWLSAIAIETQVSARAPPDALVNFPSILAGVENKGSLGYIPKLDVAGSIAAPNLY